MAVRRNGILLTQDGCHAADVGGKQWNRTTGRHRLMLGIEPVLTRAQPDWVVVFDRGRVIEQGPPVLEATIAAATRGPVRVRAIAPETAVDHPEGGKTTAARAFDRAVGRSRPA